MGSRDEETALQREFLRQIGVPRSAVDHAISDVMTVAKKAVHDVLVAKSDYRDRSIVLSGSTGVGKTTAAVYWLASLVAVDPSTPGAINVPWFVAHAMFVKAYELGRLNLRYNIGDRVRLQELKSVRYLVIDDLGCEHADSREIVEELVDARTSSDAKTLITTNLVVRTPSEDQSPFAQRYGARVVDRLRSTGPFVKCGGESENLRQRK